MVILEASPTAVVNIENSSSLREERKRTGRYVAIGTAIFLILLGCYVALDRGTWQYAALLGSALIMFVYVFWILYASNRAKKRRRLREMHLLEISSHATLDGVDEAPVKQNNLHHHQHSKSSQKEEEKAVEVEGDRQTPDDKRQCYYVNRSYSIA